MRFAAGSAVRLVFTKWGDRAHWAFAGRYLGADEHGDWVGFPAGTEFRRPGAVYVAPVDQVSLVPGAGAGYLATFHAVGGPVRVYADLTLAPRWEANVLHAVDMDLDVVGLLDGTSIVDDEDEFAEHRAAYGYPDEVVAQVRQECDRLLAAIRAGAAPFDGTADTWLAHL